MTSVRVPAGRTAPAAPFEESRAARLGRVAHINVLIAADRDREAIEERCKPDGITRAQYSVLWVLCLADAREGLPVGALADGLVTRQPDVTRLVDRLAQAGLVTRTAAAHDRRVVLVTATARGRAVFERCSDRIRGYHEQQWSHLTQAELRQLNDLLAKALWGQQ